MPVALVFYGLISIQDITIINPEIPELEGAGVKTKKTLGEEGKYFKNQKISFLDTNLPEENRDGNRKAFSR